jgi:hypothetical protein
MTPLRLFGDVPADRVGIKVEEEDKLLALIQNVSRPGEELT